MATAASPPQQPTPERFFGAMNAYQQTEAMKTAVELGVLYGHCGRQHDGCGDCEALRGLRTRRAHAVRFSDDSWISDERRERSTV